MAKLLFLFGPVIFGGFCILWGETVSWLKTKKVGKDSFATRIFTQSRERHSR